MKSIVVLFVLLSSLTYTQGDTMTQALEISTFRVIEGTPAQSVIEAARALDQTLRSLGMVSRTLSYDETNSLWVDVILWKSSEAAKAAPEIMMQREEAGAFLGLMIPESITMQHLSVMSVLQ